MPKRRKKSTHLFRNFFLLLLVLLGGAGWLWYSNQPPDIEKPIVAIVPLDSRPCNTQYPQVLGQMAHLDVLLPDHHDLDNFQTPSHEADLWAWLENDAAKADKLIIFTNQLFNGGLIASRDADNYQDIAHQAERLAEFCRNHAEQEIVVVTVLPRLKPTQFRADLWQYEAALSQWARDSAQALSKGEPQPEAPADVPAEVVEDYSALYLRAEELVNALAELAEQNTFSRYIIGQDDSEEYSFSNLIYQEMAQRNQPSITAIHGADELTMLILANLFQTEPASVRLVYTNPSMLKEYYPYEAADLQTVMETKLAFAGLTADDHAEDVIIIHNDSEKTQYAQELLAAEKNHYVGLADIAYTNRGDYGLKDTLFARQYFEQIDCYAGWNTASNTIGTVIAHYRLSDYAAQQYGLCSAEEQAEMLEGLVRFKAIRWAEDQIYQAHISPQLTPLLREQKLIDGYSVFAAGSRDEGQKQLERYYSSYQQELSQLFSGTRRVHLGEQEIVLAVADFYSTLTFPWSRTFEVQVDCSFTVEEIKE